ncbi:hypothetical protein IWQ60_010261 [Tieghemiomyces parasiticus]|uniref:Uncharacterized protein n=1 Tax=Tieghemiomyces parasiticus TaxID=78921 RepID=A0A9W7ZM10_9FUNG|nr:hypothetical protein IWQ60_010261 [Tieghemiomyces parasiticus]
MYFACPCLNTKVHITASDAILPTSGQPRRWRLALAGVVAEQPLLRSSSGPGDAQATVTCVNCDTAVYRFDLPATGSDRLFPVDGTVFLAPSLRTESQCQAVARTTAAYSPAFRFIIDYHSSVGQTYDDQITVQDCLAVIPRSVVQAIERRASDYLWARRRTLLSQFPDHGPDFTRALLDEQELAERDTLLLVERLHQLVTNEHLALPGTTEPPATALRVTNVVPHRPFTGKSTVLTTDGDAEHVFSALPRRPSVVSPTDRSSSTKPPLESLIDPVSHIPLPPLAPGGYTDEELAALSYHFNQLEVAEQQRQIDRLRQLRTVAEEGEDSVKPRVRPTTSPPRQASALPPPRSEMFEFDREEPSMKGQSGEAATPSGPAEPAARYHQPSPPDAPVVHTARDAFSASYAPAVAGRSLFPRNRGPPRYAQSYAASAMPDTSSVYTNPSIIGTDSEDPRRDMDAGLARPDDDSSEADEVHARALVDDEGRRLYPLGKPFSHRTDRFTEDAAYPLQAKERRYEVSGGPVRYAREKRRLLRELGSELTSDATSDHSDSDDGEAREVEVRTTKENDAEEAESRDLLLALPRRAPHTTDESFATTAPVQISNPMGSYHLSSEARDYMLKRQIFISQYVQQQQEETARDRAGQRARAVGGDNDGWDPVSGATVTTDESDVESTIPSSGTATSTGARALAVPTGPPRPSDPLFRGARSFVPPHELAAISYAADPNSLFGSKPQDLPQGRMYI